MLALGGVQRTRLHTFIELDACSRPHDMQHAGATPFVHLRRNLQVVAMRLPVEMLVPHLGAMLEGILLWASDSKNKFKLKVAVAASPTDAVETDPSSIQTWNCTQSRTDLRKCRYHRELRSDTAAGASLVRCCCCGSIRQRSSSRSLPIHIVPIITVAITVAGATDNREAGPPLRLRRSPGRRSPGRHPPPGPHPPRAHPQGGPQGGRHVSGPRPSPHPPTLRHHCMVSCLPVRDSRARAYPPWCFCPRAPGSGFCLSSMFERMGFDHSTKCIQSRRMVLTYSALLTQANPCRAPQTGDHCVQYAAAQNT